MKNRIYLHLPGLREHCCGRHTSPVARAAFRRGNAAGRHGGPAKYGRMERRHLRQEERHARLGSAE